MMTAKESKKLKIGDTVNFSDGVLGKVIDANWHAVMIEWEDGQTGPIHHDDMQDVSRAVHLGEG